MSKRLLIRDLSLRDGQQSQLATRMTQAQVDRICTRPDEIVRRKAANAQA